MYGTVLSFRRDLVNDTVFNGIRTARMEIKHDIPSTVRIVGEFIKFWYPDNLSHAAVAGTSTI